MLKVYYTFEMRGERACWVCLPGGWGGVTRRSNEWAQWSMVRAWSMGNSTGATMLWQS